MRILVQRVSRAEVRVGGRRAGSIGKGFVLLLGVRDSDGDVQIEWMREKVLGLRLFADPEMRMNLSLADVGGEVLVVSQFTLYGDARRGRRPSFTQAARPEHAIPVYEKFVARLRESGLKVETGVFGEMMEVELVNDGPVTIWLER